MDRGDKQKRTRFSSFSKTVFRVGYSTRKVENSSNTKTWYLNGVLTRFNQHSQNHQEQTCCLTRNYYGNIAQLITKWLISCEILWENHMPKKRIHSTLQNLSEGITKSEIDTQKISVSEFPRPGGYENIFTAVDTSHRVVANSSFN